MRRAASAFFVLFVVMSAIAGCGGSSDHGTVDAGTAMPAPTTISTPLPTPAASPTPNLQIQLQFAAAKSARVLPDAVTQIVVYGGVAAGASQLRERLVQSAGRQVQLARSLALLLAGTAVWSLWHGLVAAP